MVQHLLVAISGHGFGHLAQTAPVVKALMRRDPALRVTVWSPLPRAKLHERFGANIHVRGEPNDIGILQENAIQARLSETARAYSRFHCDWSLRVEHEARRLEKMKPDLLLANIPYLPIAAAARVGIPAVGIASLNWAGLYQHFFGTAQEAPGILEQIVESYAQAEIILKPAPSMAAPPGSRVLHIGPLAAVGHNRRAEINQTLGITAEERLVLISLGGFDWPIPVQEWCAFPNTRWLVPSAWQVQRPDVTDFEKLAMPFPDALASCDALLCKPGYGSFVEATCSGKPVLYVPRPDWPECDCLIEWLHTHGHSVGLRNDQIQTGNFSSELNFLWSLPKLTGAVPLGVAQAADLLRTFLHGRETAL